MLDEEIRRYRDDLIGSHLLVEVAGPRRGSGTNRADANDNRASIFVQANAAAAFVYPRNEV